MSRCRPITPTYARRVARDLGYRYSDQLLIGMRIEREHRNLIGCDAHLAAIIAKAHLRERPDYYKRLLRYVERES